MWIGLAVPPEKALDGERLGQPGVRVRIAQADAYRGARRHGQGQRAGRRAPRDGHRPDRGPDEPDPMRGRLGASGSTSASPDTASHSPAGPVSLRSAPITARAASRRQARTSSMASCSARKGDAPSAEGAGSALLEPVGETARTPARPDTATGLGGQRVGNTCDAHWAIRRGALAPCCAFGVASASGWGRGRPARASGCVCGGLPRRP
jgi:hypothetical protein